MIAELRGTAVDATARISGGGGDLAGTGEAGQQSGSNGGAVTSQYRGAQGLDPDVHHGAGEALRLRQAGTRSASSR